MKQQFDNNYSERTRRAYWFLVLSTAVVCLTSWMSFWLLTADMEYVSIQELHGMLNSGLGSMYSAKEKFYYFNNLFRFFSLALVLLAIGAYIRCRSLHYIIDETNFIIGQYGMELEHVGLRSIRRITKKYQGKTARIGQFYIVTGRSYFLVRPKDEAGVVNAIKIINPLVEIDIEV